MSFEERIEDMEMIHEINHELHKCPLLVKI